MNASFKNIGTSIKVFIKKINLRKAEHDIVFEVVQEALLKD